MARPKGSPDKKPFFRDMLEEIVLGDSERFNAWAVDNFTDAVKELGKLQPKNVTLAGDANNPIQVVERVIRGKSTD